MPWKPCWCDKITLGIHLYFYPKYFLLRHETNMATDHVKKKNAQMRNNVNGIPTPFKKKTVGGVTTHLSCFTTWQ